MESKYPVLIVAILLLVIITGTVHAQGTAKIDLKALSEVQLDTTLEIGEAENYLPSRMADLVVSSGGVILLSDTRQKTIEQFNATGEHLGTIARVGKGPGELPQFFKLLHSASDTLQVWHNNSRRLDRFVEGAEGVYTYHDTKMAKRVSGSRLELITGLSTDGYLAVTGKSDQVYIKANTPAYRESPVAWLNESLELQQDSLYMLTTANLIFSAPGSVKSVITMAGLPALGIPPYRYEDRMAFRKDGSYLVGQAEEKNITIYSPDHTVINTISLDMIDREVTDVDLNQAFKRHRFGDNAEIRNKLETYVTDLKPPFLGLWASAGYILLHTDIGERGNRYLLMTVDGQPLGTFWLPAIDTIQVLRGGKIYAIRKDSHAGHRVRIYEIVQ